MKYLVIIVLFVVFFSSCQNKDEESKWDGMTIHIGEINEMMKLSEVVDSFSFIPLETSDESLLADVTKVRFAKGKFFIYDEKRESVFSFSESGGFIRQFGTQGKGPEEYLGITDFDIVGDTLFLHDAGLGKMLIFNFEGEYLDSFVSSKIRGGFSFVKLEKGLFGFYWSAGFRPELYFYDRNRDEKKKRLIQPQVEKDFIYSKTNYFTSANNRSLVFPNFNDTVFEIKNETVEPYVILDCGKYKAPREFYPVDAESYGKLSRSEYIYKIYNIADFKHSMALVVVKGSEYIPIFISKRNKRVKVARYIINDLFGLYWGGA